MDRSPRGALRDCCQATRDGAINAVQQWVAGNPEEKILLDLERARMEREDFRLGNAPATPTYKDGKWEYMSWSKWLHNIIDHANEANDALRSIRTELRDMDGRVPMDIADNYTKMAAEVNFVLGEASDEESDEESGERASCAKACIAMACVRGRVRLAIACWL